MLTNPKFCFNLVNSIMETNEWLKLENSNPVINSAQNEISNILNSLENKIPDENIAKLRCSINDYVSASTTTAVLYGIQVAIAAKEIINNPNQYSEYFLEKIIKKRKSN